MGETMQELENKLKQARRLHTFAVAEGKAELARDALHAAGDYTMRLAAMRRAK